MNKRSHQLVFFLLALTAAVVAVYGFICGGEMAVPRGVSVVLTMLRVGLLYLAFLCVLLAIDLSPQPTDDREA
jgi:hypothetical protein